MLSKCIYVTTVASRWQWHTVYKYLWCHWSILLGHVVLFNRWWFTVSMMSLKFHKLRIVYTYLTYRHWVKLTVEHILLHCVSSTNARDDFSELLWSLCLNCFRMSPLVQSLISSKKLDFIVKFEGIFYLNFKYLHSSFHRLHIICVYPIYQHLHCTYILNL